MSQARAITSQRPKCANLAKAGTNAFETVGNRRVKDIWMKKRSTFVYPPCFATDVLSNISSQIFMLFIGSKAFLHFYLLFCTSGTCQVVIIVWTTPSGWKFWTKLTGDPKYDEEDLVVNDCTFEMVMEDCEEWIVVTETEKGSKGIFYAFPFEQWMSCVSRPIISKITKTHSSSIAHTDKPIVKFFEKRAAINST